MKTRILAFLYLLLLGVQGLAQSPALERVLKADDARVASILAPDREGLSAAFSDELRYAHSNGVVDTKESFIRALCEKQMRYLAYDHQERSFTFPVPGIALMTGRARMRVVTPAGEVDTVLGYLGVWREEAGVWKFLSWQSCRLPPQPAVQGPQGSGSK
jgi:hypothetical protein